MQQAGSTTSPSPFSDRYQAALSDLFTVEGGFVDDPADKGGATKYGISLRFLVLAGQIDANGDGHADFDLDMDGDIDGHDVRQLTRADAARLYHRCFWQAVDAESFDKPIGEMLFDQAVNGGLVAARRLLQRAVNICAVHVSDFKPIAVDGIIGPHTRLAMICVLEHPGLGRAALVEAFREAVRERYRAIVARNPSQKRFLRGWLARAERLGR